LLNTVSIEEVGLQFTDTNRRIIILASIIKLTSGPT
jgi:hypothetical protein